jgi:hypothetical protein
MTYLEAAVEVLRAFRKPLTTRELTDEALRRGLINPAGKTPAATMSSALYGHLHGAEKPTILRESLPGPSRAMRGSVRWRYAR